MKRFLSLSAALPALLPCPGAAKWDIVPTLSVGETYTDNVSLAPDALKQADWVTQLTPGISIAATGARLRFNATYAPQVTYYARGQQDNQIYQQLNATGNAELAEQLLFIDAGANVGQQNVSLRGPLTTSNVNTTGNRATVGTYFVSPYLRHDFGSDVQAEARFAYSVVNSDDQSLPNSIGELINLRLGSGPAYKLLAWDLNYFRSNADYEGQPDTSAEVILASARRLITPTVGLLAQAGYENYESGVVGPATGGQRWSTGLDWTPSPRTRLAATVGERFFGNTYFLDLRHRARLTTWCAGYLQKISSTRAEFFGPITTSSTVGYVNPLISSNISDPAPCQNAVESVIAQIGLPPINGPVNFFSSQLFLVKRFQALAAAQGVRNLLVVNVFNESREVSAGNVVLPGTGDFAVSNTIIQTGTSLLWNWRMTAQNAWYLGGAYSRIDYPDIVRIDHFTYVGMGLTGQFQPRLSGSLNYRRQQNDSNQSASSYTENALFATLQMKF